MHVVLEPGVVLHGDSDGFAHLLGDNAETSGGVQEREDTVGGTSWLGAAVMDRTEQKLCSLISEDERYRGGNGAVLNVATKARNPGRVTHPRPRCWGCRPRQ